MESYVKKITPKDVFVTTLDSKEYNFIDVSSSEIVAINKNRPSGNEFMDKLAELLSLYKMRKVHFYEERMGIKQGTLSHFTKIYSGMMFSEWRNQYIMLAAKELLLETNDELQKVGQRLGFSGISTFSRWFVKNQNESPSDWRRRAKRQQAKQDKELLLKIKQERRIELLTK